MLLKNWKKVVTTLIGAFCLSMIISGCEVNDTNTNSNLQNSTKNPELSGSISIIGSTSVQPLAQELADAYSAKNKAIKIDVQGIGSTAGIKAISDGTCDIGTSSRDLAKEEKTWNLTEHVIAIDGIAVIVNPKNSITNLTKEQITKIFKGEIKNWKEIGGIDKEIMVVSREAGSGTRGAFEEMLKIVETKNGKTVSYLKNDALIAQGNGAVIVNVAGKENAIGYASLGLLNDTIKAVKVNGVDATTDNVKNGKYAISRPFIMLTKGEENSKIKSFLNFIISDEGQKIVSKNYIVVK